MYLARSIEQQIDQHRMDVIGGHQRGLDRQQRDRHRRQIAFEVRGPFGQVEPRKHRELAQIGVGAARAPQRDGRIAKQFAHRGCIGGGHHHRGVHAAALQRLGRLQARQRLQHVGRHRHAMPLQQQFNHGARAAADGPAGDAPALEVGHAVDRHALAHEDPQRLVGHRAERDQPVCIAGLCQPALHQRQRDAILAVP